MGWNMAGASRKNISDGPEFSPFFCLSEPFLIRNHFFKASQFEFYKLGCFGFKDICFSQARAAFSADIESESCNGLAKLKLFEPALLFFPIA